MRNRGNRTFSRKKRRLIIIFMQKLIKPSTFYQISNKNVINVQHALA
ncbi:hypothetical protein [Moraxella lacunata]